MRRTILLALGLAFLAIPASAETKFNEISATATSSTTTFSTPRANVMICSIGANKAYFRLFDGLNTPAAASTTTTGNTPSSPIVAGTATNPVCISFGGKPDTQPAYYSAISVVCDTAETATIWVYSN